MNRENYVRVTEVLSILSSGLHTYLANGGERAKATIENAREDGTALHRMIEIYNKGIMAGEKDILKTMMSFDIKFSPAVYEKFKKYVEWQENNVVEIVAAELPAWNETYKYRTAGVDLICLLKGDKVPTLIDLKSPFQVQKTWALQTEAYSRALKEMGVKVGRRMALRVNEDMKAFEFSNKADWTIFLYTLEIYHYLKG